MQAVLGGNASPSAADIEKICKAGAPPPTQRGWNSIAFQECQDIFLHIFMIAGGVSVEADRVAGFLKEVEGKNLEELLEAGRGKLASMPAAGAAPAAAAGGGGGAAAPAAEEKKVEEESEDEVCHFSLQTHLISVKVYNTSPVLFSQVCHVYVHCLLSVLQTWSVARLNPSPIQS